MIDNGDGWRGAVRLIAINPTLRAEAERLLPALNDALVAAEPEAMMSVLIEHTAAFGIPPRRREEFAAMFAPYLAVLEEMPLACVEEAFVLWGRCEMYPDKPAMHQFYPKSSDLFTLAKRVKAPLAGVRFRVVEAMKYVDKTPKTFTAEERAAGKELLRQQGILGADGKIDRSKLLRPPNPDLRRVEPGMRETPQQMAERIRRTGAGDAG